MEASAGTGKTFTITGLVIRLLLGDFYNSKFAEEQPIAPLDIEDILVITFTRFATADLKRKIRERIRITQALFTKLQDVAVSKIKLDRDCANDALCYRLLTTIFTDSTSRGNAIKLLQQAQKNLDKAGISTIHSFCGRMLKRFATDTLIAIDSSIVHSVKDMQDYALQQAYREFFYADNISADDLDLLQYNKVLKRSKLQDTYSIDHIEHLNTVDIGCHDLHEVVGFVQEFTQYMQQETDIDTVLDTIIDTVYENLEELQSDPETLIKLKQFGFDNGANHINRNKLLLTLVMNCVWSEKPDSIFDNIKDLKPQLLKLNDKEHALLVKQNHPKFDVPSKAVDIAIGEIIFKRAMAILEVLKTSQRVLSNDDMLYKLHYALSRSAGEPCDSLIAKQVRRLYPVAIIDEFQDTDPIQFSIVKMIYLDYLAKNMVNKAQPASDFCGFYIVGDPKQSIYSFRGADVNCYLSAVKAITDLDPSRKHVLATNYRSDTNLVAATNTLFNAFATTPVPKEVKIAAERFKTLDFHTVSAHGKAESFYFKNEKGKTVDTAPCQILNIGFPSAKLPTKPVLLQTLAKVTANKIVDVLNHGWIGSKKTTEHRVTFKDLVVLVANINEAEAMAKALRVVNIPAIYTSDRRSILETPEFQAMRTLMQAVLYNRDREYLKKFLLSSFFCLTAKEYDELIDDTHFEKLLQSLAKAKELWLKNGFMAMYEYILNEKDIFLPNISICTHLLQFQGGNITLTNLMHVAEIAVEQSQKVADPLSMIPLFARLSQKTITAQNTETEDNMGNLRMPSDKTVVRIMTHHASKGLEFPIVFMPFAGMVQRNSNRAQTYSITYYDDKLQHKVYDVLMDPTACQIAKKQEEEERVRVWYVAATRPIFALFLCNCEFNSSDNADFEQKHSIAPFYSTMQLLKDTPWALDEQNFAVTEISTNELKQMRPLKYIAPVAEESNLTMRVLSPELVDNSWHITSYSALTQFVGIRSKVVSDNEQLVNKIDEDEDVVALAQKQQELAIDNGMQAELDSAITVQTTSATPSDDINAFFTQAVIDSKAQKIEQDRLSCKEPLPEGNEQYNRFTFARGANAGTFLHAVLEEANFNEASKPENASYLAEVVAKQMRFNGIAQSWQPSHDENGDSEAFNIACDSMRNVMRTPIIDGKVTLADIPDHHCLKELEFLMTIDNELQADKLNRIISEYYEQHDPTMRAFTEKLPVNFNSMKGYLVGFIDLLVYVNGKFYVIDYKSNHLGNSIGAYKRDSIAVSIAEHRYDLQYIIYTVALKRFLQQRYSNYRYDDLVGGVAYLYLRGMNGKDDKFGVYNTKLDEQLINAVDQLLSNNSH